MKSRCIHLLIVLGDMTSEEELSEDGRREPVRDCLALQRLGKSIPLATELGAAFNLPSSNNHLPR